ncbi:DUF995 domain-containing protein [Mesorhizobium sp. NPDC059054]|uniref:DUF995 domain-containing protein n=1 Tax=Mesorhizobium sp. NPDC059054 TaxID=3346711 RepID=UPI0036788F30
MSIVNRLIMGAVLVGMAGVGTVAASAAPSAATIKQAEPLSNDDLYRLYSQRSWIWKDGAGYFAVPQRRFSAWTGKGRSASYGVGSWFIADVGRLCFRADWYAKSGSAPALTCFSHRRKGNVIFQKREPKGDWYVFANAPVRKGDEITKLRRGDYVMARLSKVEDKLAARR